MIKMLKLIRMLKAVKERDKFTKYIKKYLKIDMAFERLFLFVLMFMLMVHIGACSWVFISNMSENSPDTWITRNGY